MRRPLLLVLLAGLLPACVPDAAPRVYPSADAVEPLAAGDSVPAVRVRTIEGESVDLAATLRERGALLVFYRGGW